LIAGLIFAGLIVSSTSPVKSMAPPPVDTAGGGSFTWGSYEGPEGSRRYKLYVPPAASQPRRLLVMLHGCTQDPDDFARGTRMNQVAGEKGFMVLYPEQPATANPLKCWNWFASAHQKRETGEPALLAAMIRSVVAAHNIDSTKVYVAGISAGGAMAAILGATYPEIVSAMAIHSGIAYGLATEMSQALIAMRAPVSDPRALAMAVFEAMGERRKTIPLYVIQGSVDASVNVENAKLLAVQWRGVNNGFVDTWIIEGLGHAWSGGSKEGTFTDDKTPDASRAIVEFLLKSEKSGK